MNLVGVSVLHEQQVRSRGHTILEQHLMIVWRLHGDFGRLIDRRKAETEANADRDVQDFWKS